MPVASSPRAQVWYNRLMIPLQGSAGNPDRGVLYIATQLVSYAAEAFLSAWSLKERNKSMPVTIATNLPTDSTLFERFYDRVVDVSSILPAGRREVTWAEGLRHKVLGIQATPYRETLFIDADTRVRTSRLGRLFARLGRCNIAMTEASPDMSRSRQLWGKRMFLTGVVLYDSSPATKKILREWAALSDEHFRLAARKRLSRPDWLPPALDDQQAKFLMTTSQASMARLLSPGGSFPGLKAEILPKEWNYRTADMKRKARGVKIEHQMSLRNTLVPDLLRLSHWFRERGDAAFAERYSAYIKKAVRRGLLS